jgi:hypothetical protein
MSEIEFEVSYSSSLVRFLRITYPGGF